MNIKKKYKEILHKIQEVTQHIDLTQSNNLLKIIKLTKLKYKFNCIDYWDRFEPNISKPYSILNTDREDDKGNGTHWVGVFQEGKKMYIYDSFARKNVMNRFCEEMEKQGYKCRYTNKKGDQQSYMIDCGLRSLLWLLFVDKYGILQASKI